MTATLFPTAALGEVFTPSPSRRRPWRVETRNHRGDRVHRVGSYATEAAAIDRAGGLVLTLACSSLAITGDAVCVYHRDTPGNVTRIDPLALRATLRLLDLKATT